MGRVRQKTTTKPRLRFHVVVVVFYSEKAQQRRVRGREHTVHRASALMPWHRAFEVDLRRRGAGRRRCIGGDVHERADGFMTASTTEDTAAARIVVPDSQTIVTASRRLLFVAVVAAAATSDAEVSLQKDGQRDGRRRLRSP